MIKHVRCIDIDIDIECFSNIDIDIETRCLTLDVSMLIKTCFQWQNPSNFKTFKHIFLPAMSHYEFVD